MAPRKKPAAARPRSGARPARPVSRRDFARGVAVGIAAAALGACGRSAAASSASGASPACTLYPEQTQGPFYLDARLLRRDLTEGRPGTPLRLELQIQASSCAPLGGVTVDVWHCDAAGLYSGYDGQLGGVTTAGQTFLRGSQVSGDDGRVLFDTIYPGWYPGRTTHVHFKVHVGARSEATSQIYFPEETTAAVYATPPYAARGPKDTSNAADGVVRFEGAPPLARVSRAPSGGLVAALVVAVAT
jgi:protocatechuate 3,4-dioxygenase beta subunit